MTVDLKPADFHGFLKSADKLIVGSSFERAFSQLDYREALTKYVQNLGGRHPFPATFLGGGIVGFLRRRARLFLPIGRGHK